MEHRAAIVAVALPVGLYLAALRYPHYVQEAERVLRAALAWLG